MGRLMGDGVPRAAALLALFALAVLCLQPGSLARTSPASTASALAKHPRLDHALAQLSRASTGDVAAAQALADSLGVAWADGHVQVIVTAQEGAATEAQQAIEGLGGRVTGGVASRLWLQAWLPPSALVDLADSPAVAYVAVAEPAWVAPDDTADVAATPVDSLSMMGLSLWHLSGYQGQGIRIGIIDVGFGSHIAHLGDALPIQVVARNFVDGEGDAHLNGGTNHGTAVAEIVHRVAPQADLYLAKIQTIVDLHDAVAWLLDDVGVQVIQAAPLWYALSPGDGTGVLADLVHAAHAQGVVWVAPAGDARVLHWSGDWVYKEGQNLLDWSGGERTNWLLLDGEYNLPRNMPIDIWLRWSDWDLVDQDLDLCLVHFGDGLRNDVTCSDNPQTGFIGQTPTERLRGWTADYDRPYAIMVQRMSGDRPLHIDVFIAGATTMQHRSHSQSLADLADAPAALSVSAVQAQPPFAQPAYSSEGPTKGPGGVAAPGLAKPDLAAYAGVATASRGIFPGTSAAAAHVTGAVAVVRSAHPAWGPDAVHDMLRERALDLGEPGWDPIYGHGRLYLGNPAVMPLNQAWLPLVGR